MSWSLEDYVEGACLEDRATSKETQASAMTHKENNNKRASAKAGAAHITSTDWVPEYAATHLDIDPLKVFGESSDGLWSSSDVPPLSGQDDAVSSVHESGAGVVGTDWLAEYNTLFGGDSTNSPVKNGVPVMSPPVSADLSLSLTSLGVPLSLDTTLPTVASDATDIPEHPKVPTKEITVPTKVTVVHKKRKTSRRKASKQVEAREYVDEPTDIDCLFGRGGKSNHHPGNNRYRDEVKNLQDWYKRSTKTEKTELSELLVKFVYNYGGRFLKEDKSVGKWYIVRGREARRKASQALREHCTAEERAEKRRKAAQKKG